MEVTGARTSGATGGIVDAKGNMFVNTTELYLEVIFFRIRHRRHVLHESARSRSRRPRRESKSLLLWHHNQKHVSPGGGRRFAG
jgi:hypothetical protein